MASNYMWYVLVAESFLECWKIKVVRASIVLFRICSFCFVMVPMRSWLYICFQWPILMYFFHISIISETWWHHCSFGWVLVSRTLNRNALYIIPFFVFSFPKLFPLCRIDELTCSDCILFHNMVRIFKTLTCLFIVACFQDQHMNHLRKDYTRHSKIINGSASQNCHVLTSPFVTMPVMYVAFVSSLITAVGINYRLVSGKCTRPSRKK